MKTITLNNKKLEVYDSVDELPIVNFQRFNKYVLIDSGLGSDMDSVDRHIINIAKLLQSDKEKALIELQNLRQNFAMIISNISPKHLSFMALVKSIDGKDITDWSDEKLTTLLAELNHEKRSIIVDILEKLKKN